MDAVMENMREVGVSKDKLRFREGKRFVVATAKEGRRKEKYLNVSDQQITFKHFCTDQSIVKCGETKIPV